MLPRHTRALVLAAVLAALALSAPAALAQPSAGVVRSADFDRIGTAVAASRDFRAGAETAVLATAVSYPDALSAGALAGRLGAPLLLTAPDVLPPMVGDELGRLGARRVVVLGGEQAIGAPVVDALLARGLAVERLAGDNRFATARAVALAAGPSATGEVVVALGDHPDPVRAWPDAVAAGALAATPDRVPTLLVTPETVPVETEAALTELGTRKILLLGGEASVYPAVADALRARGYEVERIAGASRSETSVAVAELALGRFGPGTHPVVLAGDATFPDALSAGALAAAVGGPLVLVPAGELTAPIDAFLRAHADVWDRAIVVGGPAVASDHVLDQIGFAIRGEPFEEVIGSFSGEASWYGPGFEGNRTACGQRFDSSELTAAHRSLPCGTRVRVTNLVNGAQVTVEITDRGPYARGRVLDLSRHGAEVLGFIGAGHAQVRGDILR